ncbi:hypothetical protein MMC17_001982 [Xylographa soralifera]|nr:hypothetical protein [Xylographa soralifera]
MGSVKRKVPSGRGRGRPSKVRRGSQASLVTSSSPVAATANGVDVMVPGANLMHLEAPVEKDVEKTGITSGNESFTGSESQIQRHDEEQDDAGNGVGNDNKDGTEVAETKPAPVVKRGRGRPKKTTDKARVDDNTTGTPNGAPETTQILENEDEDDSKVWGIEARKQGLEIPEMASSPSENIAKRGRGRPRKSDEVNAVLKQLSTPDSAMKRGRGRPRKSDSNIAVDRTVAGPSNTSSQSHSGRPRNSDVIKTVDQKTILPSSTSSLRRPGRPKKAFVLDVTVNKSQKQVDRSATRQGDSATEDTEEENEEGEKKEEGRRSNKGVSHDQKKPEAGRYDVHKASPISMKAAKKRKRDVPEQQENLVDSLSVAPRNTFQPATLRDFSQSLEVGMNMSNSAANSLLGTPLDFENDFDNDFTAEEYAAHASTKRPRLLPSPEFTAPLSRENEGIPNTGIQTPSQFATFHHATGMDGSHTTYEGHAAMDQAHAALQNLREVHGNLVGAETSPGLQFIRVAGQNPAQSSQPSQSLPRPSNLANRVNDRFLEPPGGSIFTKYTARFFGGGSEPRDGVPNVPESASEGAQLSVPTDIVPSSRVANSDTGLYYGANEADPVAPVAPMLMQDEWSETMLQLSDNRHVK